VKINNVMTNRGVWFLLAHDGLYSSGVFYKVTDCYQPTGTNIVLTDFSAPLTPTGRTYAGAFYMTEDECCCTDPHCHECGYVMARNVVFAPYPFFSNPVISSLSVTSGAISVTYGEGLYTNTVLYPTISSSDACFFWITSSNPLPTNAQIHTGNQLFR
jgi:hypothetical protein